MKKLGFGLMRLPLLDQDDHSSIDIERFKKMAHPELEYVQIQLNYLDWNDPAVESRLCYEVAVKHHKPVIVMEPVKGGSLIQIPVLAKDLFEKAHPDLSVASWAIRFAASPSHVMMVLSGMSDEQQVVDHAVKIIRASAVIPCTACRYCTDTCPKKIAIPDYFALYNNMKRSGDIGRLTTQTYYSNLTQNSGKASECLKCGKCEKLCPQHLPIRVFLQDVAAALE